MIVLVHGNPETAAVWDGVRELLGRPSVAVSLPCFGSPRPAGFGATGDDYVEWLVGEIDRVGEPVDLVGRDWGALLTYRVATRHGGRLRSWAADVASVLHPDYVWHDIARVWQTPGDGEELIAGMVATDAEAMAAAYEEMGLTHDAALRLAGWLDATMGAAILDLYRSVTPNPYAHWGADLGPTAAPGLVIDSTADPFNDPARAGEVARLLGARTGRLEGLSHFWPLQDPAAAVALLTGFWDSL